MITTTGPFKYIKNAKKRKIKNQTKVKYIYRNSRYMHYIILYLLMLSLYHIYIFLNFSKLSYFIFDMSNISEYLEEIITKCGGFGRFQLLLTIIILSAKLSVTWTILMMVFAGATPDWWCVKNITFNATSRWKACYLDNRIPCQNFAFDKSMNTIVNQVINTIMCNL